MFGDNNLEPWRVDLREATQEFEYATTHMGISMGSGWRRGQRRHRFLMEPEGFSCGLRRLHARPTRSWQARVNWLNAGQGAGLIAEALKSTHFDAILRQLVSLKPGGR